MSLRAAQRRPVIMNISSADLLPSDTTSYPQQLRIRQGPVRAATPRKREKENAITKCWHIFTSVSQFWQCVSARLWAMVGGGEPTAMAAKWGVSISELWPTRTRRRVEACRVLKWNKIALPCCTKTLSTSCWIAQWLECDFWIWCRHLKRTSSEIV